MKAMNSPVRTSRDVGVMITVHAEGGAGYAATSDLTQEGLAKAADRARQWARSTAGRSVVERPDVQPAIRDGEYRSRVARPWKEKSSRIESTVESTVVVRSG